MNIHIPKINGLRLPKKQANGNLFVSTPLTKEILSRLIQESTT